VHLVDVSDASGRPDPVEDFKVIMNELESFGAGLEQKPMILVASKADVANPEKLDKLTKFAKRKRLPLYSISAVTGEGIKDLTWAMAHRVQALRDGRELEVNLPEEKPAPKPRATKKKKSAAKKAPAKAKKKTAAKKSAKKKSVRAAR
jgi:GTP-binding protein